MAVDGYLNFDTKMNVKGFVGGVKNIGKAASSAALDIMSAVNRVTSSFGKITKAYQTQIEAEARFETTIRNSANATEKQIQSVKDLASSLQELGVVGDEVQLAGAQELSTYVGSVDSVKKMLPVLNDMIAQQYGFSASTDSAVTIATMLGKVLQGQTSALSRYGYSFDEAQEKLLKYGTEEQRVATLAAVVEESVSGVNEALANTPTGKVKQLSNDFGDLKETTGKLLTEVLYPLIVKLDVIVKKLNEVFSAAISGIKTLFGISDNITLGAAAENTENIGDYSDSAADNFTDIADEAERAEKANKGSLNAFDELNVLSQEEDQTPEITKADDEIDDTGSEPVELPVTFEKSAFEESVDELAELLKEKWQKLAELTEPAREALERLKGTLETISEFAGDNLINFYDLFLKPLGQWALGKAFPKLVDIIDNTLQRIDFEKINTALSDLYTAAEPFAETIGDGLLWFLENVLSPFAAWAVGEAFPAFVTVLTGFLELVDSIGKPVGSALQFLWDNFFSKVASFAGDVITGFLTIFGQVLSDIAANDTAVASLLAIAGGVIAIIAALKLVPAIQGAISFIAGIPAMIAAIANPIGLIIVALIAVGVVIVEIITYWDELKEAMQIAIDFWKDKISSFWENLKTGAHDAWEKIKSTFKSVGKFFGDIFSKAWEKVKAVFSAGGAIFKGIKEGILNAFKKVVNSLIDGINNVVAIPFDGINGALAAIRDFEIAGVTPFSWIPQITVPEIPHLAKGTVIPANYGEFAAILGDNKREAEVVSPVSAIEQAVENVLNRRGITSSPNEDIVVQIDRREVFRATQKEAVHWSRMHGGKPAFSGA